MRYAFRTRRRGRNTVHTSSANSHPCQHAQSCQQKTVTALLIIMASVLLITVSALILDCLPSSALPVAKSRESSRAHSSSSSSVHRSGLFGSVESISGNTEYRPLVVTWEKVDSAKVVIHRLLMRRTRRFLLS